MAAGNGSAPDPPFSDRFSPDTGDGLGQPAAPPLRVVVALGDPERERQLLPLLDEPRGLVVTGRCLSADELLPQINRRPADVALLASDLHHLTRAALLRLLNVVPRTVVLVAERADDSVWRLAGVSVLPQGATPEAVVAALKGEVIELPPASDVRLDSPTSVGELDIPAACTLLAVIGPDGSVGRTTIAVNLATGLGAVAPTVVVDGDLRSPAVAAHLDADPTRNVYMLAHASPRSSLEWDRALEQEVQPIGTYSRHGSVLCGVPKPEMRGRLTPGFLAELLGQLAQRYRYVVLDGGDDVADPGTELGQLLLSRAAHVLVVVTPDLVGMVRGQRYIARLRRQEGLSDRLAVVVNRYHRRHHSSRQQMEWALHSGLAAIVPQDYHAAERALIAQRPLVLQRRSRARASLLELAGRIHDGEILLPAEPLAPRKRWQPARVVSRLPSWRRPVHSGEAGA